MLDEGEVEIIMIRGQIHAASIISAEKNAAPIRGRLVFKGDF